MDGRRRVAIAWRGESLFQTIVGREHRGADPARCGESRRPRPERRRSRAADDARDLPTRSELRWATSSSRFSLPADEYGNPWGLPPDHPLVFDMRAAERDLGYRPVTTYAEAVKRDVRVARRRARERSRLEGHIPRGGSRLRGRGRGDSLLRVIDPHEYRDRFPILSTCTYLINHSLAAMPAAAEDRLREYTRMWRERGIRSWGEGWWECRDGRRPARTDPRRAAPTRSSCTRT